MTTLKYHSLLMVGNSVDKNYFKEYFQKIILVQENSEILKVYQKEKPSLIFLANEAKTLMPIIKNIRKNNRQVIIVLLMNNESYHSLLSILPFYLFSCLVRPFNREKVKELLFYIEQELKILNPNIKRLKENYLFNIDTEILYNPNYKEIRLTKNEKCFLIIMSNFINSWVSMERIEYSIWEIESFEKNCEGRLKSLINGLRKKLPKKSIVNQYGMGYKLQT